MTARIRLAEHVDAGAIAAIYRPSVEAAVTSFETVPPDHHEMARRIAATLPAYPWLVCDIDGGTVGYAYATRHNDRAAYRWSVNTSVYIDAAFSRGGVGRGLYASLFAILAAQGYVNAFAGVTLPNPASVGLHEAMGFEKLGVYRRTGYKFGGWHDVGWWQLTLLVPGDPPAEPTDVDAVRRLAAWPGLLARGEPLIRTARPRE